MQQYAQNITTMVVWNVMGDQMAVTEIRPNSHVEPGSSLVCDENDPNYTQLVLQVPRVVTRIKMTVVRYEMMCGINKSFPNQIGLHHQFNIANTGSFLRAINTNNIWHIVSPQSLGKDNTFRRLFQNRLTPPLLPEKKPQLHPLKQRITWIAEREEEVREARQIFDDLTQQGKNAFFEHEGRLYPIRAFDPDLQNLIFMPRKRAGGNVPPAPESPEPLPIAYARLKQLMGTGMSISTNKIENAA